MSREILMMIDSISREKDLPEEAVAAALEDALAFAAKKKLGGEVQIEVDIDRKTGEQRVYRVWEVVETENEHEFPERQIYRGDLPEDQKDVDRVEEQIEVDLGRQSAQLVKQAIMQKLKEIEQAAALAELRERGDELLFGTVKGFRKGAALIEIGRLEALLPRTEMLPKDQPKIGSRIRVAIKGVEKGGGGETVIVSRASNEFMKLLVASEVAQVEDGEIEIVKLARTPGVRCKMIVRMQGQAGRREMEQEGRIHGRGKGAVRADDPVRIIIGARGVHAKAIAEETGENIDVLVEDPDLAQMVVKCLAPAEPNHISIDEESRVVEVELPKESLGLAIGTRGANIRMISDLLGWTVDVMDAEERERRKQARAEKVVADFAEELDMDDDSAVALYEAGFNSLEEVGYCSPAELEDVGFDEDSVKILRSRAQKVCERRQSIAEIKAYPARESLAKVEGISKEEIETLIRGEVYGADDLADLATDELLENCPRLRPQRAQALIMAARKLWEIA